MIQKFVERFDKGRGTLRERFRQKQPSDYKDVVKAVMETVSDPDGCDGPNAHELRELSFGDYQGTLIFVAPGWDSYSFYMVKMSYGSCSVCDTFQSIVMDADNDDGTPSDTKLDGYMKLALHVVQGIKEI